MQRKSIVRISTMVAPAVIASALLAIAPTVRADDEDRGRCSNQTLLGDYGFTIEGTLLTPPGVFPPGTGVPIRGVAMTHFDGQGYLSQVDHVVVNGAQPKRTWTPGNGPYTVNADCTGTAVINTADNPPLHIYFVIVRGGTEIHTVVDANAVTSIGIRVRPPR